MKTNSLFLSLNLELGIPERIQLLPAGEFILGRDGRKWTKRDAEAIAKKSNEYLTNHPIDENHATDLKAPKGESSPAMGWFSSVYAETDGSVWAQAEWTDKGKQTLQAKEYRYLSPVFENDTSGEVVKILRAALTNRPNLELPNLNNTQSDPADNPEKEKNMESICAALGLSERASENDIIAAIAKLKVQPNSKQEVDLTAYAPRADLSQMEARATEAEKKLAELNAEQLKEKAVAAIEKAISERKIAPASKEAYLAMCSTEDGLSNFEKIVQTSPAIISEAQSIAINTLNANNAELNAEDEVLCKAMGYTKEQWLKIKGENK